MNNSRLSGGGTLRMNNNIFEIINSMQIPKKIIGMTGKCRQYKYHNYGYLGDVIYDEDEKKLELRVCRNCKELLCLHCVISCFSNKCGCSESGKSCEFTCMDCGAIEYVWEFGIFRNAEYFTYPNCDKCRWKR